MSNTNATRASDSLLPPVLTGSTNASGATSVGTYDTVHSAATSTAAARQALGLGSEGKFFVTVQAVGYDTYIAFKLGTAAATITALTGYLIPAGGSASFWITSSLLNDLETIATGVGSVRWYRSSPVYDNNLI